MAEGLRRRGRRQRIREDRQRLRAAAGDQRARRFRDRRRARRIGQARGRRHWRGGGGGCADPRVPRPRGRDGRAGLGFDGDHDGSRRCEGGGIMIDRRTFISLLASAAVAPRSSFAQGTPGRAALYSSVGPVLTHYDVDVEATALTKRASVTLPANVQYAWPHASGRYLYVASSSSAPGTGPAGTEHHVSAFRIDPASGALAPHGNPIRLPTRPIHITTDIPSRHVLVAFNNPSALRVYRITGDATLGEEVQQRGPIEAGIYGHQVRVTANNRLAIFVARGNDPAGGKLEDPGALKVFSYKDGLLTNGVSIAPNGGYGFGPRHLDFHPTQPWVYVSLERQNRLDMFAFHDQTLLAMPVFQQGTLAGPATQHHQPAGTVHVHSNGRTVYVANRASDTVEFGGQRVFAGGENTLPAE